MSLIGKILTRDNVLLDLDVASKKRVFEQVGLLIENTRGIARSEVFECLFAREKLGSTGLGQGVAIPHGRCGAVRELTFRGTPETFPGISELTEQSRGMETRT